MFLPHSKVLASFNFASNSKQLFHHNCSHPLVLNCPKVQQSSQSITNGKTWTPVTTQSPTAVTPSAHDQKRGKSLWDPSPAARALRDTYPKGHLLPCPERISSSKSPKRVLCLPRWTSYLQSQGAWFITRQLLQETSQIVLDLIETTSPRKLI